MNKLLRICYRSYWDLLSHAIPSFTTAQVSWSRAFSHCGPHSGRMVNGWAVATQEKNRGFPEEMNSLMHDVLHHIWEREQKSQDSRWPLHRFLIQVLKTENRTTISTCPKRPAFLSRYLPVGHDWTMPWSVVETYTLIQDPKSTSRYHSRGFKSVPMVSWLL